MKFWCYSDFGHDWGANLFKAAQERGHLPQMFDNPRIPDDGVAFVHMHHHPETRALHKRTMETLATNAELLLVPSFRGADLFDDKLRQLRELARYMPHTVVYQTPGRATEHIDTGKQPTFPFVSKAREGTASRNVRVIPDRQAALTEINFAFSDKGIKLQHGQMQRSYLMWQRLITGVDHDLRIVRVGSKRLVLKRYPANKKTTPSRIEPVSAMDDEVAEALFYANAFFKTQRDLEWCAIDLIYDKEKKRWFLLEVSVSWQMAGFADARFIDGEKITPWFGTDIWHMLVTEIEQGQFGEVK